MRGTISKVHNEGHAQGVQGFSDNLYVGRLIVASLVVGAVGPVCIKAHRFGNPAVRFP